MAKLNLSRKHYSLAALATLAVVGGAYLVLKTFPHLTEFTEKTQKEPVPDFDSLNDEELKKWLSEKKISVPEDSSREALLSLAKSL